jgi:hypothetical protein
MKSNSPLQLLRRFVSALALVLCVLLTARADDGGGDTGGIVNLPGTKGGNNGQSGPPRLIVNRDDCRNGLMLALPTTTRNWIVVAKVQGQPVLIPTLDRLIALDGGVLFALQQAQVASFGLSAFDLRTGSIDMTIDIDPITGKLKLTVW